jgi:ABC-type uncharacterized transport system permease subunit
LPGPRRGGGTLDGRYLRSLEATVTSGLILLALLAVLVGFGWTRLRRRAGLSVTGRHWAAAIVIFAIVVLALWATSTTH